MFSRHQAGCAFHRLYLFGVTERPTAAMGLGTLANSAAGICQVPDNSAMNVSQREYFATRVYDETLRRGMLRS